MRHPSPGTEHDPDDEGEHHGPCAGIRLLVGRRGGCEGGRLLWLHPAKGSVTAHGPGRGSTRCSTAFGGQDGCGRDIEGDGPTSCFLPCCDASDYCAGSGSGWARPDGLPKALLNWSYLGAPPVKDVATVAGWSDEEARRCRQSGRAAAWHRHASAGVRTRRRDGGGREPRSGVPTAEWSRRPTWRACGGRRGGVAGSGRRRRLCP